jgi:hypothetical protein
VQADPGVVEEHNRLVDGFLRGGGISHGDMLYTYRLAFAVTGEWTAQAGGTVSAGLARIVETVNRINEIMGQDWSVALELVPNNDLLVYTNGATDPYSNGNLGAMIDQNQNNVNSVIGSANYDIGHVSGTGGESGLAGFRVVCNNGSKARGAGQHNSTGGEQYKLVTAHEMGHQFGASHTFNSSHSSCIGQRSAASAYEPGGGSTIMAYAGRCGDQQIQPDWDPYYHAQTYAQVVANITGGPGSLCPTVTPTGNTPPVALAETVGHFVPLDTPWLMNGSATDADGDSLTYCWEQYDLGPAGHPNSPEANAPIFRSFSPTTNTFRYFPRIGRILNNNHRIGEILPTYERNVRLRLTVRDGLGGVHWDQGFVGVDGTAGPFQVTSQSTATTWNSGTQETITWDVANSDNGIVNCQTVNILMSEGAITFPHVLASGVPNDGSQMITVPPVNVPDARVMVQAADNIFYDINDGDITIIVDATDVTLPNAVAAGLSLEPARPNPFAGTTRIAYSVPTRGHASMRIYDTAGRLVRVLFDETVAEGQHAAEWDGLDRSGSPVASGVYFVRLKTERGSTGMQKVHLLR